MNRRRNLKYVVLLGIVLSLAGVLWAQRGPDKVLVVNGKTIESPVIQIDGHSYVNIETLAQITNGVIAVQPDRIVLTIRPEVSSAAPPPPPPPEGLSKEFAREAIAVLPKCGSGGEPSELREVTMSLSQGRGHRTITTT